MAEIIECPRCQRKLRMADSILGQTVVCPACQMTFTAELPNQSAPPRPADAEPPVYRPVTDEPAPRRYDDEEPSRRRRFDEPRPRRYEDDDDYPRRRRDYDYRRPHRGSQIQTLGILSIVLCCFPLPAFIMAIIAIVMAVTDLAAMNRGDMDDSGRTQTKTGLVCAIIAPVILGLAVFTCIGFGILSDNM